MYILKLNGTGFEPLSRHHCMPKTFVLEVRIPLQSAKQQKCSDETLKTKVTCQVRRSLTAQWP